MSTRLTAAARGVFVMSITPFDADGTIDEPSLDRLIDFYLGCGVHGLTVLGMMGEAGKLTHAESLDVVARVLRRAGASVPVVVGVSGSALRTMTDLAHRAMEAGAAGVMVAPPSTLKTDEQVAGYYATVSAALGDDVPIVLQDYPQSTGVHFSVPLCLRLVRDVPAIVVLKHEDCPGLAKISGIRTAEQRDGLRRIAILVGNGGLYYPLELGRGADGAMTGFGYPEMLVEVYERFSAGDAAGAEDLFDAYLPLVRYEQQPGIGLAVRKEILRRRGVVRSAALRAPGPALSALDHAELDRLIDRLAARLERGMPQAAHR